MSVVEDPQDARFTNGSAICVATVHKLFNGRSVFGTSSSGVRVPVGTIVVDDAHACLKPIRQQFTCSIPSYSRIYQPLLGVRASDLQSQSRSAWLELRDEDAKALMPVPAWSWHQHQDEVVDLLHGHRGCSGMGSGL